MEHRLQTITLRIGGMTCEHCRTRVEEALRSLAGVSTATVDLEAGQARLQYDAALVSRTAMEAAVTKTGYTVLPEPDGRWQTALRAGGLVLAIAALYFLLERFGVLTFLTPGALATADMGYGMLFVIGLTTSVHCVAMCGGINLSQCMNAQALSSGNGKGAALLPSLLYNGGRVISYTVVGFVVGALGATVSFSPALQGVLKLIAGVFMLVMGLRMLGLFPKLGRIMPHMPKWLARRADAGRQKLRSPLLVGLLNGLMPCGPLQAMQIYALSTGSALMGALSMFLFSLGTVPLMLAFGALSTALGRRFARRMVTVGAVLVAVLGLSMLTQGATLAAIQTPTKAQGGAAAVQSAQAETVAPPAAADTEAAAQKDVQRISSTLASREYPSITVEAGVPVEWTINAPAGSINGCNNRMLIPEYGIEHTFTEGDNLITFTPDKTGTFQYSCWMGMIRATITVVEAGQALAAGATTAAPAFANLAPSAGEPEPSGVAIDTGKTAVAEQGKDANGEVVQRVRSDLTVAGFAPAVLVVEAGTGVEWSVRNDQPGALLLVPDYRTELPLSAGENTLYFTPEASFVFSDAGGTTFGYVMVVNDITAVDMDAVKAEAAAVETLRYPAGYFGGAGADSSGGASCCQ